MTIWISSLAEAPKLARRHKPARVVSLLSPYDDFPTFAGLPPDNHLRVAIHDIVEDAGDWRAPARDDAQKVVSFVEQWDRSAPLLIHCWAGISRSTASAFIAACLHNPRADEEEIAWAIRDASRTASPNARLVAHADAILGRDGRMVRALETIGRGSFGYDASPFEIPSRFGDATPAKTKP
jgi:predicted protein tyrosine phosphatase